MLTKILKIKPISLTSHPHLVLSSLVILSFITRIFLPILTISISYYYLILLFLYVFELLSSVVYFRMKNSL